MKNDLTGKRFGRLTAKFVCGKSKDRHYMWHCVCDCGNEYEPSNCRWVDMATQNNNKAKIDCEVSE